MITKIKIVQLGFVVWIFAIIIRLFYWQVAKSSQLKEEAQNQYLSSVTLPAVRGEILSSDGFPLVINKENYLLYTDLKTFPASSPSASRLLDLLPASASARTLLADALRHQVTWLTLAHNLSWSQKQHLSSFNLPGLYFDLEPARHYPEGSASAYLTGFFGKNDLGQDQGYFGLEGYYDRLLSGKSGKLVSEHDAFNRPIVIGGQTKLPPQNGSRLTTSIDRTLSYLILNKLSTGLAKYRAAAGTVTLMDSRTGQILSMVSLPGYEPDRYSDFPDNLYKNPIISDGYEPGSTFKVIVMVSALDSGAVKPETICEICTGPVTISGETIGSWNGQYYPGSSMYDVILHSDNVGMVFVSRRLGKTKMLDYIRRFGFGKLTGIDLQEESTPELRPDVRWQDLDWATAAFGQGIAVTRLQMVAAVNAIATGGLWYPPRVVTAIDGRPVPTASPTRIVSTAAASQVTQMMLNGVTHGEVRYYRPAGFLIAGKTGTAQVPIAGHYDPNKTIASFIGFAPAENPKFTMLVTLQNPQSSPWGSTTAAPLWFDISREIFRYYHIAPQTGL